MVKQMAIMTAAALIAATGSVLALQPATGAHGGFDRPLARTLGSSGHHTGISGDSDVTVVVNDNGEIYELKIRDGEMTAKVNGEKVPSDRIRHEDGKVVIVDEDGEEVYAFHVAGDQVFAFAGPTGEVFAPEGWGAFSGDVAVAAEPPRVMIGINRSEPDATLMEHLGLEPGIGIRIDEVYEGLPAADAGLEANDIIIALNGESVTSENLRDLLDAQEPGDTVKVRVIRKGQQKDFNVTLRAYDAAALGVETPGAMTLFGQTDEPFAYSFGGLDHEAHARIAQEMAALAQQMAANHGEHAAEHAEAMQRLAEELSQHIHQGTINQQRWLGGQMRVPGSGGGSRMFRVSPDGNSIQVVPSAPGVPLLGTPPSGSTWSTPSAPAAPSVPSDELTDRLERLEQKLERLERLLEKLER